MNYDACRFQRFEDVFDTHFLSKKTICVAEKGSTSADFIIVDLAKALNYPVVSFYDTKSHYKSIFRKYYGNEDVSVMSWLENDRLDADSGILDDALTMKKAGYRPKGISVWVYRSDTCDVCDYYNFDLILEVSPLKSGVSMEVDGYVRVFDRENVYYDVQYKITKCRILYKKC